MPVASLESWRQSAAGLSQAGFDGVLQAGIGLGTLDGALTALAQTTQTAAAVAGFGLLGFALALLTTIAAGGTTDVGLAHALVLPAVYISHVTTSIQTIKSRRLSN